MNSGESAGGSTAELFRSHNPVEKLFVAGFVDKDSGSRSVTLMPSVVWLDGPGGLLALRVDEDTGYLKVADVPDIQFPEELTEEPSIEPVLVDLSIYYLSEVQDVEFEAMDLYGVPESTVKDPVFRAVVLRRSNGRMLVIDPLWPFGIKIGNESDLALLQEELEDDQVIIKVSLLGYRIIGFLEGGGKLPAHERAEQSIPARGKARPRNFPDEVLALQRTMGNRGVSRLIDSGTRPEPVQASARRADTVVQRMDDDGMRPAVRHREGAWTADDSRPARSDGLVLSGHGGIVLQANREDNYFRIPAGTRLHFYTDSGQVIPDALGGEVETGRAHQGSSEQGRMAGSHKVFAGGRSILDCVLSPPSGLVIQGDPVVVTPSGGGYRVQLHPGSANARTKRISSLTDPSLTGHSITFSRDVRLSEILTSDMKDVHFAACRFKETDRPGTRNQGPGLYNPP